MNYLVAAYMVLGLAHLGYVWSLVSRRRRVREELEELSRKDAKAQR